MNFAAKTLLIRKSCPRDASSEALVIHGGGTREAVAAPIRR